MTARTAAEEELYGLPLEEFTATRNRLAREAREQGDRDAAEAIRSLRKPSAAAWALNQLARSRADEVRELVAAGERLRRAQEDLLVGGDRAAFAEASKLEQELVSRLAREAVDLARESGSPGGEALRHRISDTLRAAALDPTVAESLAAGRLVREHTAAGLGAALSPPSPPAKGERRPRASRPAAERRKLEEAERLLRKAEQAERSAQKRQGSAGRTTARLRGRAEEALDRLRAAEADEQAAGQAVAKAADERSRLARRVQELRRAVDRNMGT